MIKALLIDDEISATELLKELLLVYCPDVEVVASCNESTRAAELIRLHHPDLVFLDIEMPKLNGFELLQSIPDAAFQVIFVTAYNQFAVQAFRYAALDYLLKPIEKSDLLRAINKFKTSRVHLDQWQLAFLQQMIRDKKMNSDRIGLTVRDGVRFVEINEIIRCQAEGNYTRLYFIKDSPLLVSRTLGDFEEQLTGHGFFRISNSYLINLQYIEKYSREDGGYVVLKDGEQITVSKNKREAFLSLIHKI